MRLVTVFRHLIKTFTMFEKTVPVLEEAADPPDLPPGAGGGA